MNLISEQIKSTASDVCLAMTDVLCPKNFLELVCQVVGCKFHSLEKSEWLISGKDMDTTF